MLLFSVIRSHLFLVESFGFCVCIDQHCQSNQKANDKENRISQSMTNCSRSDACSFRIKVVIKVFCMIMITNILMSIV